MQTSQSPYAEFIQSGNFSSALAKFIYGEPVNPQDGADWKSVDDLVLSALSAISTNNKSRFLEALKHISRREPSTESDWLYNDALLYSFLIGVKRFKIESPWLEKTLTLRTESTIGTMRVIGKTMLSVLSGENTVKDLFPPLVIVSRHLLGLPQGNVESLNETYESLIRSEYEEFDTLLSKMMRARALDVIVISKDLSNFDLRRQEKQFVQRFKTLVRIFAVVIHWAVAVLLIALFGFLGHKYIMADVSSSTTFDKWITLFSIAGGGVSLQWIIFGKARTIKWVEDRLLPFFHFPDSGTNTS